MADDTRTGKDGNVLTVACVLKSGGEYNAEYVAKLRFGVTKYLHEEFQFICLSDTDVPCGKIPLKHGWPSWWSKMELFLLPPPVLYFDLDTIIVGNLGDIAKQSMQPEFTILCDFYRMDGFGSGMMAWGGEMKPLYEDFARSPQDFMNNYRGRGDQGFIEDHINRNEVCTWQKQLPGQIVSYKDHVRIPERSREIGNGKPPQGTRVVCFHGRPKPKEVGWLAA